MEFWRNVKLTLLLIYVHSTVKCLSFPSQPSSATSSLQAIGAEYEPDNKIMVNLEDNLKNSDDYDFEDLETEKNGNPTIFYSPTPSDRNNNPLHETSTDVLGIAFGKSFLHPKHNKHLIIPMKLRNRQTKLRLLINKALKPKFKTIHSNHHDVLLGRTHEVQSEIDGGNSDELLRNILILNKDSSETGRDLFKNALLTKSRVYNITKMPSNSLQKGYYVHKKENISVGLSHSNTNYSDTHIISLETIINPDTYTPMEDVTGGEKQEYIGSNENAAERSNKPDYPTEFVGGVFLNPHQSNFEPSPDSSHPIKDPQKVPTDFIGGTFIDEKTTDSSSSGIKPIEDENSEGSETNADETTVPAHSQEEQEGDGSTENPSVIETDVPDEQNTHDTLNNSETDNPEEQGITDSITTEIKNEIKNDLITTIPPRDRDDLPISTLSQIPKRPSLNLEESESDEYFDNTAEVAEASIFQRQPKTGDYVTEGVRAMSQQNVVTEFREVNNNSENKSEQETDSQTTTNNDLKDGLVGESSNTHTSIAQNEFSTTLSGNSDIIQSSNDNYLDEAEEENSLSEHGVELFAGENPGKQNNNDLQENVVEEENTTDTILDDNNRINTESTTEDPSNEFLTELCLPLMNYKDVSLYSLLSGNFFLNYKGKTIPLELGEEPMKSCHSGTKKCKLHLKLSNNKNNQSNNLDSNYMGEDKDSTHDINKRQVVENSKFKIDNSKIINHINNAVSTKDTNPQSQLHSNQENEDSFLNKIRNIGSKHKSKQNYYTNSQDSRKNYDIISRQTDQFPFRSKDITNTPAKNSDGFPRPSVQEHMHENAARTNVGKRYTRSIHSAKSETKEDTGSSCGCGDILGKALAPIPPYEHFLGKRLDILTNVVHAVKDWFVSTS